MKPPSTALLLSELTALASSAVAYPHPSCPGAYTIETGKPGPHALISGVVHGNEPCGYYGICDLLRAFGRNELKLISGKLTVVISNLEAFVQGKQQIDYNLNRLFRTDLAPTPNSYEHRRIRELLPIFSSVDYLLDLHATTAPTIPFAMCENSALALAEKIGLSPIVLGWGELGAASLAGDTETFVNSKGGLGVTVECGQRDWDGAAKVAFDTACKFLQATGISSSAATDSPIRPVVYKLDSVFTLRSADFRYSKAFISFDKLGAGEIIGSDSLGVVRTDRDCIILMPANPAERSLGQDLYLLAHELSGGKMPRALG